MASTQSTTNGMAKEQPKQRHSLAARLFVATAFSGVTAKLGMLGTVADVSAIVGKELTFGEKLRGVFSKSFLEKFNDKLVDLVERGNSPLIASVKVFKWTMIVGAVASVAGFVVGWARGGLIADWKDIIKHPWRSTKIIFGAEKPPEQHDVTHSKKITKPMLYANEIQENKPQLRQSYVEVEANKKAFVGSPSVHSA